MDRRALKRDLKDLLFDIRSNHTQNGEAADRILAMLREKGYLRECK